MSTTQSKLKRSKQRSLAPFLVLFLLGLILIPTQASAQAASGTYQFSLEDGYTKYLEFAAQKDASGAASGQMTLSDEAKFTIQDVDGTGEKEVTYPGFYFKAEFDSMIVEKNQAVMSGIVRDSSIREFIGQRVLLTVEDNGDNTRETDKLTWGIYKPIVRDWIPSDAELKEDPGVGLRWYATDAERKDDIGYWMPRSEQVDINSFPVSTYAFVDIARGAGDIIVRA